MSVVSNDFCGELECVVVCCGMAFWKGGGGGAEASAIESGSNVNDTARDRLPSQARRS